jgi:hypothetical protein
MLDENIQGALHEGWSRQNSKELIRKAVDTIAFKLIKETYQKTVDDASARIDLMVKERLAYAEKLVTQMTTPEAIEGLMVKACVALVKGTL